MTKKVMTILVAALFVTSVALGCGKKKARQGGDKPAADKSAGAGMEAAGPDGAGPGDARPDETARPDEARPGEARTDENARPEARTEEAPLAAGQVQAQMLIIGWKDGGLQGVKRTAEQAKALAEKVAAQAVKGNFSALVKKYSDGPNKSSGGKTMPMTEKDAAPLFKPVFKMKVGQVSKAIKGSDGYYIFKRIK